MNKLRIEVFSDIACPWCYVGKRRLEAALAQFPHRDSVEVVWRAFELDSAAPRVRDPEVSYSERLSRKYGTTAAQAEAMLQRMTDVAAADRLVVPFRRIRPRNSFGAPPARPLVCTWGWRSRCAERFLRAYMTEGEAIGEPEVLVRLATEAGLPEPAVRELLAGDRYAREVRADEEEARSLHISGVPFFVIAGRYGLSGAQPSETILGALTQAWAETMEVVPVPSAEGATCGPDGCG